MNIHATTADSVQRPFGLRRLTGSLGAEISGLDLSKPLAAPVLTALTQALVDHKVIFFRDQPLTPEQHIAFGKQFGALEIHPFTEGSKSFANDTKNQEIIIVESTAETKSAADIWHSDVSWRVDPSLGSILKCSIAPAYGGDTMWADMEAAYAGLDNAMQSRLSDLVAVHDWHRFRANLRKQSVAEEKIAALVESYPPVEHPVVRTHPVSKRKCIYVNAVFTIRIKGMAEKESDDLLKDLYRLSTKPEYQVRFSWKNDSIAFWDNRSTQHYVVADFYPQHRRMERVTVAGDRPF